MSRNVLSAAVTVRAIVQWSLFPVAALSLCVWPSDEARAQSTVSMIRGTVVDQNGAPMRGVRVTARSDTQIGGPKSAYSDDEGSFRILGLLPGIFEVSASAPGLKPVVQKGIELSVNAPLDLTFLMEVATGEETVRIVEKPPAVNASAANVKETFSQEFIERVPLTTPSYQNVADQAVGWNATGNNFRVRGGNVYDNNFMIDGFQLQDPVSRQSGQFVNFDAIAAIEVQSAAYGAENANAQGGVLNVVTRSGSNEYRFEVSSQFTNQRLRFWQDRTDSSTPTRNAYLNLSVGGPVVKDKLWFFVSSENNSVVSNLGADPSGTFTKEHPSRDYLAMRFLAKLTWQMSSRNKLSLIGLYTPERTENAVQNFRTDAAAERYDGFKSRFAGLTFHSLLTDSLFFRAQVGWNEITRETKPMSCLDDPGCLDRGSVRELVNNVTLANWTTAEVSTGRNLQLNSDLEWFGNGLGGDHRAKVGFRLNLNANPFRTRVPGDQMTTLNGGLPDRRRSFCANDPDKEGGMCVPGWMESRVSGETGMLFVQDAWKPTKHVTVTPGVALNFGQHRDPAGNTVIRIIAPTPHLSAVWDATHDGKTAVRGSFAGYVDTGFLALARYASRALYYNECRWDPMTNDYTAACRSGGGLGRNTIGQPCGPAGANADGSPCGLRAKAPRTWEFTVGAEREIIPGIALGGDYIYRRYTNQWEDAETNRVWNAGGTALRADGAYKNGVAEEIYDLSPRPENRRTYRGMTGFIRKYEGKFQALIAWTRHSQFGSPLGYNSDFLTNPSQAQYLVGYIGTDQRNEAKFMGHYALTPWLIVGTNIIYRNGTPWSRLYYNPTTGGYDDLRGRVGVDPRNPNDADDDVELREPDVFLAYIQARVKWKPLIGQDLETWVDLFNVAGNREIQSYVQNDGATWGQPAGRRGPPFLRFGLRYRY